MSNSKITFRPLQRSDFDAMARWFASEHVVVWFGDTPTASADLEAKYGPRIDGTDPTRVYITENDGLSIGFIQWTPASEYAHWPADLGLHDSVALDGLLGERGLLGQGLAPRLLKVFLSAAPDDFGGASSVIGETDRQNTPTCRTLERVGFECVFEGDLERDGKRDRRVYVYSL